MHPPVPGHLVEVAYVSLTARAVDELRPATYVGEAGQDVHELHSPRPESFGHDETCPEPSLLSGAGSRPAEHYGRCCVKALRSKPRAVQ
jgi:hypothetical protein